MRNEVVNLTREAEATQIPSGEKIVLPKDTEVIITQALGGTYTVMAGGYLARIDAKDADALGKVAETDSIQSSSSPTAQNEEELEKQVWEQMKMCYDPEIPVNIVDLGLVYDCIVTTLPEGGGYKVDVKMTLTAPGCGMGATIASDVQHKILSLPGITEANVELAWDPPWSQEMMSEAARLQLGLM